MLKRNPPKKTDNPVVAKVVDKIKIYVNPLKIIGIYKQIYTSLRIVITREKDFKKVIISLRKKLIVKKINMKNKSYLWVE